MPYPNGITLDLDFTLGSIPGGMTFARAGNATDSFFTDAAGSSYNTFTTNQPRLSSTWGLIYEPQARTNYLLNSTAPATQTTGSLAAIAHVLWVIGTGSATVTASTGVATGLGTATPGNPLFFTVTTAGTFVVTVTGSLNRFQLERGASPTSFIVTTGATAARPVETCTLAVGAWFNASAGTLLAAMSYMTLTGIAATGGVGLDDTTLNNRFTVVQNGTAGQLIATTGGVSQVNATVGTIAANTIFRAAGRYSTSGNMRGAAMGLLMTDQNSKTVATVTQLSFPPGATATLGSTIRIQRVQYWPFAFVDADLQAATMNPPLAQIAARGSGYSLGTIAARGRVRPGMVGLGVGSGRLNPSSFSFANLAMSGLGISGGIMRPSIVVAPPPRTIVQPPDVTVSGYDTLLLDRDLWDLVVDAYGDIAAAQAPYALEQDVASAIRLFLGELWYDTTKGIPYFEEVLGHWPPLPLLKQLIEQAALTVPRVAAARAFVTEAKDRTVTGQVQIATTDGQQFVLTETFLGRVPTS